ncbi:MAG: SigE family RNA polymerase sigma factor [Nocardioidaceae bacterium]|nr:SigE family RNA polymerase sigma factor [Nocardioidaceae bacterium]
MGAVQDSFAEYVGARWATLYRLAVLLVGESRADDVAQAALVRAYSSWDRVRDAASPDAYLRKILVNTAISEGRRHRPTVPLLDELDVAAESHESAVVDRDALWSRIEALPPRQRAVIVLRYYEDFSEAEIARTLGCAPGTVKAHAHAALKALRVSVVESETSVGRHG